MSNEHLKKAEAVMIANKKSKDGKQSKQINYNPSQNANTQNTSTQNSSTQNSSTQNANTQTANTQNIPNKSFNQNKSSKETHLSSRNTITGASHTNKDKENRLELKKITVVSILSFNHHAGFNLYLK